MTHHRTVILGTGFSGLGMAIRLLRDGDRDFVLLERAGEIGGTWRDNTYPGCRCDVPSHLYSYSFAPNPSWSAAPRLDSSPTASNLPTVSDGEQRAHRGFRPRPRPAGGP